MQSILFLTLIVTSQSPKKNESQIFNGSHVPLSTTPPNPTPHHSFSLISHSLWLAPHFSLLLFSFFFFFYIFGRTLLFIPSNSPTGTSMPPSPPSFLRQCRLKILRKLWESQSFIWGKISNPFGEFYILLEVIFLSKS